MKKSLKVLALTMLFTCSAAFFAYADEFQEPNQIVRFGDRVAFVDDYEFMEGVYFDLGLVSTNLDGSDKKLLLKNNGEESNVDSNLLAVGDWIYFLYSSEDTSYATSIARIKNDGSSFELLYVLDKYESFRLRGADSEYIFFSKWQGYGNPEQFYRLRISDNVIEPMDSDSLPKRDPNEINGSRYTYDIKEQVVIREDSDGTKTKSAKIRVYPPEDINSVTVNGIVDGKVILTIKKKDYYTGIRAGDDYLYTRVAADMDTGETVVLPKFDLMSGRWVYYKKEDGLYRMDMSGREEKVVDGIIRHVWIAYDEYIYYKDENYLIKVYKEQ